MKRLMSVLLVLCLVMSLGMAPAMAEQVCILEEHSHGDDCNDEYGEIACGYEEHVHGNGCIYEEKKDSPTEEKKEQQPLQTYNTQGTQPGAGDEPQEPSVPFVVNAGFDYSSIDSIAAAKDTYNQTSNTLFWYVGKDKAADSVYAYLEGSAGDYTLKLVGQGKTADFANNSAPWYKDYRAGIKAVDISEGITYLGERVFNNTKISTIHLPASLSDMHGNPFHTMYSLESITVESGNLAFKAVEGVLFSADNKNLIKYPSKKTDISYVIPEGVENLCTAALLGTGELKTVSLPSTLKTMNYMSFSDSGITEIYIPDSLNSLGSDNTFANCKKLTKVSGGKGLSSVPQTCFEGCSALSIVDFSEADKMQTIGFRAFRSCPSLTTVKLGTGLKTIGNQAFCGDTSKNTGYAVNLSTLVMPSVVSIGDYAFYHCSSLDINSWPSNLENVGKNAFEGSGIKNFVIKANLKSVGEYAFNCGITKVDIETSQDISLGSHSFNAPESFSVRSSGAVVLEGQVTNGQKIGQVRLAGISVEIKENQFAVAGSDTTPWHTLDLTEAKSLGAINIYFFGRNNKAVAYAGNDTIIGSIRNASEQHKSKISYAVTNGGTYAKNHTFTAGELDTPENGDLVLVGWFTKDGSTTGDWGSQFTGTPEATKTYYAQWRQALSFTVSFDSQQGSAVADQTVLENKTVVKPADPTRSGYKFDGWFSDSDCTQAYDFSTAVTADITLYAKWTEVPAAPVKPSTGSGSSSASSSSSSYYYGGYSAPSSVADKLAPTVSGVKNGESYYGDTEFSVTDRELKTVTLDGKEIKLVNGKFTIPADNQEHVIIATDKSGNKTTVKLIAYKNYTVTYMVDGQQLGEAQTVGHGQDAKLPQLPQREGFEAAWELDGKNITADTVINAVYTQLEDQEPAQAEQPEAEAEAPAEAQEEAGKGGFPWWLLILIAALGGGTGVAVSKKNKKGKH